MLRCTDDQNIDDSKLCPGSREVRIVLCVGVRRCVVCVQD